MVTFITDVRVPADQFLLGRLLQAYPDAEIELERIVPMRDTVVPLFWVTSGSEDVVEETLRTDPLVEEIAQLVQTADRTLYSVSWRPTVDGLVRTLARHNVDVLSADGTADSWTFRLQFRDRADLNRFRRACRDQRIDLTLLEQFHPQMPLGRGPLTPDQKDVLATAYEMGYWDVPRRITQQELADLIGVTDSRLSRRLRDGVQRAVGTVLYGRGGKPFEPPAQD